MPRRRCRALDSERMGRWASASASRNGRTTDTVTTPAPRDPAGPGGCARTRSMPRSRLPSRRAGWRWGRRRPTWSSRSPPGSHRGRAPRRVPRRTTGRSTALSPARWPTPWPGPGRWDGSRPTCTGPWPASTGDPTPGWWPTPSAARRAGILPSRWPPGGADSSTPSARPAPPPTRPAPVSGSWRPASTGSPAWRSPSRPWPPSGGCPACRTWVRHRATRHRGRLAVRGPRSGPIPACCTR